MKKVVNCEGCRFDHEGVACLLSQDDFCPGQEAENKEKPKAPINFDAVETD
jgi:hypothetical protein